MNVDHKWIQNPSRKQPNNNDRNVAQVVKGYNRLNLFKDWLKSVTSEVFDDEFRKVIDQVK